MPHYGTIAATHLGSIVAARALATYLIPRCVGRGVRLGSESSSSGGAGGVWKSGNLEIWGPGNLGIWKSGDLDIQKFGDLGTWTSTNLEIWGFGNPEIWDPKNWWKNIEIIKIQIRSAQNVGKVWISRKKSSWPYLGPSEAFYSMNRKKSNKQLCFYLFPLVGQWALFTRGGPLLPSTRGGAIGLQYFSCHCY